MYKLTTKQRESQATRLRNLDLRLVVGYLKTVIRFVLAHPEGPLPIITEGHRDRATQARYYAQGRTTPGPIITNKPPGTSLHELSPSRAVDVGFLADNGSLVQTDVLLRQFYTYWLEHSTAIEWGGLWQSPVDAPHFQVQPLQ